MPGAVIYGPLEYKGTEILESYTLQDQLQVTHLMKHIRWGGKVANTILVTLDNTQLAAGLIWTIFDNTRRRLDYIDQGWLTSLRKRMGEIDAMIWIEDAWRPELQRVNNAAIVELFVDAPGITLRD